MTKPSDVFRWGDVGASITTPASGKKDIGWVSAEKPDASVMNYLQNGGYQWRLYLRDLEAHAHTWTVNNVFNAGITVTHASGSNPIVATAVGTGHAVRAISSSNAASRSIKAESTAAGGIAIEATATSGTSTGIQGTGYYRGVWGIATGGGFGGVYGESFAGSGSAGVWGLATHHLATAGVYGTGAISVTSGQWGSAGAYGKGGDSNGAGFTGRGGVGVFGQGGDTPDDDDSGQDGGYGIIGVGGAGLGQGNIGTDLDGGPGGQLLGGAVDGTLNDLGSPGIGAELLGGGVTSDTQGRVGGVGAVITGGVGGGGRGKSFDATGDGKIDPGLELADSGGLRTSATLQQYNVLTKKNLVQVIANIGWIGAAPFLYAYGHQRLAVAQPAAGQIEIQIPGSSTVYTLANSTVYGTGFSNTTTSGIIVTPPNFTPAAGRAGFGLYNHDGTAVDCTLSTGFATLFFMAAL